MAPFTVIFDLVGPTVGGTVSVVIINPIAIESFQFTLINCNGDGIPIVSVSGGAAFAAGFTVTSTSTVSVGCSTSDSKPYLVNFVYLQKTNAKTG